MMATARQGKFLVALMAFCRVRVLFPSYAVFVGLVSGFFRRRHVRLVEGKHGPKQDQVQVSFGGRFLDGGEVSSPFEDGAFQVKVKLDDVYTGR